MYKLGKVYGKQSFDAWGNGAANDLSGTKIYPAEADADIWEVTSFRKLVEAVAFLTSMNKRLTLLYRGSATILILHPVCSVRRGGVLVLTRHYQFWNRIGRGTGQLSKRSAIRCIQSAVAFLLVCRGSKAFVTYVRFSGRSFSITRFGRHLFLI